MKKSTAVLLLLALFSNAQAIDVTNSTKVYECHDIVSGTRFVYNLSTFVFIKKESGVSYFSIYDSVGVKHVLSTKMTKTYLTCKAVR